MAEMKQSLMRTLTYDSKRLRRKSWVRALSVSAFNFMFAMSLTTIVGIEQLEPYLRTMIVILCYTGLLFLSIKVTKKLFRNDAAIMQTYIQYGKGTIRYVECYYYDKRYRYDIYEIKDISYVTVNKKEIEILGNVFKTKDTHGEAQTTEQNKAVLRIKNTFRNAQELAEGWDK